MGSADLELWENPLREGLETDRSAEPCVLVIFGASGDLTRRKLVPALFNLAEQNLLPYGFTVLGVARSMMDSDQFRNSLRAGSFSAGSHSAEREELWNSFARGVFYLSADPHNLEDVRRLGALLDQIDRERGTGGRRVYYLALPPSSYQAVVGNLGESGLANAISNSGSWVRVIIEKPFGRDLETARELNYTVHQVFREEQVYRIDHYLGKETVQNILVLRLANGIFEPIWNRRYIDSVQITAAETLGVESRGTYYEEAGLLRDMVQNHLLQLLCLTAMEPPVAFDAESVRDEKVKVLRTIRPFTIADVNKFVVRGQYQSGSLLGREVPAYRNERNVSPQSPTETFTAMRLHIDNWRWADVPFYLRSGKRLPKQITEIAIRFKQPPHLLFGRHAASSLESNVLALRIQPDEGISLKFEAKLPGQGMRLHPVMMDFRYGTSFGVDLPTAYETLLLDCVQGDTTLFTRRDEVEAAWSLMNPVLESWQEEVPEFPNYEAGSWGPASADELIRQDGREWRRL
jgi:glucose-6-phosphate 1-dehydrogenase